MQMSHKERRCRRRMILLFLIITTMTQVEVGVGGDESTRKSSEEVERGPSFVERAIGITGAGLNSHQYWDKLKTWAKMGWMKFQPPSAGFGQSGSSAEVVKEAASRSFETSKETVEKSAFSAAKAAGDAVGKTKEKVEQSAASAVKAAGDAMEKTKEKLKRKDTGGDPDAEL